MSLDLFRKLVPFIKKTKLIYLQGWGEPLLNKNLFEMIRICKENGRRVGFTTNGMFLTEAVIRELIRLKIDILGVSLAGTTATAHNKFRQGTDFSLIISNLEGLLRIKRTTNSPFPALHLAYIMLTSNFHELKEIVPLAKRLEAQQIVSSHLSLIMDPELSNEAVFNDRCRMDDYSRSLEAIKVMADREGIIFAYNPLTSNDHSTSCSENIYKACVINVSGEVIPCVFVNPVLQLDHGLADAGLVSYVFKDKKYPLEGFSFGNLRNKSFAHIWQSLPYVRFRNLFKDGPLMESRQFLSELPNRCLNCYKRLMH